MFGNSKHTDRKLNGNRLNDTASSAIFQFHVRCFTPPLSETERIKIRNGTMAYRLGTTGLAFHVRQSSLQRVLLNLAPAGIGVAHGTCYDCHTLGKPLNI